MLLVPHYIAPSQIHGLGCFSSANVKKGETIWEYNPIIDRLISESDLSTLPDHIVKMIQTHAEFMPHDRIFSLGTDGDFFMNHSDDSNLENFGDYAIARKDIAIGDEITCNYRETKVWSFPLDDLTKSGVSDMAFDMQAQI